MDISSNNQLAERLKEVTHRLLEPPSGIFELINLLDDVQSLLIKVKQVPSGPVQEALLILKKPLIEDHFFRHPDPNVRVTIACCLNEVMRITAPVQPYDDDKMKEIFELIVSSFENLSCQSDRCYPKSVFILKSFARLRSSVMMLDLDCDLLIIKMFESFQRTASLQQPHSVLNSMESIMSLVIQETDSVSLELLKVLLSSIRMENQSASPASWELGVKIIEECTDKLKPFILEMVSSMGYCLEDYAPILSSICKSEPDILKIGSDDSCNSQDYSREAEHVQDLVAVDCHSSPPVSRDGKVVDSGSGGTASRRRKTPILGKELENGNGGGTGGDKASLASSSGQLKKSSVTSDSEDADFPAKGKEEVTDVECKKPHSLTSADGSSKKEGNLMQNEMSGQVTGKVLNQKKDVSGVLGSSESKLMKPKKDHSSGSGNKGKAGQRRKDKIQSNDALKNHRKRASSDDDVIETPHGRKNYKHDLVGSRIKVWWPLDRRFDALRVIIASVGWATALQGKQCYELLSEVHGFDSSGTPSGKSCNSMGSQDSRYYEGTITSFDDSTRKHKVDYDDGDEEVLNLRKEQWEFVGDELPTDIALVADNHTPASNMFK